MDKKVTIAWQTTPTIAGLGQNRRGITVGEKPTLAVLPLAKKNHFKGEIRKLIEHYRTVLGEDPGLRLMITEDVLFDESEIVSTARQMEQDGADLIVLVVGTWLFSSIVASTVVELNTPVVLYGLSDQIANGNLGASLQIRYVLEEMGKKPPYLCGQIADEKNLDTIRRYLKAAWVKRYLRNRNLATIGGKCMMMYQTQVNEFDWKRVFGVDFPQYDTAQVFYEMETVDEDEARAVADEFLSRIGQVNWEMDTGERICPDAVVSQAKMFLAFKRLQQIYDIDIFANKCMPEMSHPNYGYGYPGCVATCMANEAGITVACEADVPAALSMYILRLLSGQPVFFADIARLNKPARKITFFNCGTAPISMADPDKIISLWPVPDFLPDEAVPDEYFVRDLECVGACINFELPNGREVTLLRVGGNGDTLRFHAATAITSQREVEPEEVLGNRWPGFGLTFKSELDRFLQNTTGHHYSIVVGNYVEELRCLAELLGIKFVYDR